MTKNKPIVTMTTGHEVTGKFYDRCLNHFGSLLNACGARVVQACKPVADYDYSYVVEGLSEIPRDVLTQYGRAGLKTTVERLSKHTSLVRLKT